jgi:hypothetical protein
VFNGVFCKILQKDLKFDLASAIQSNNNHPVDSNQHLALGSLDFVYDFTLGTIGMLKVANVLYRFINLRNMFVALFIFLPLVIFMIPWAAEELRFFGAHAGIPDTQFYYTAERAYQLVYALSEEGLDFYLVYLLTLDLLLAFSFFFMATTWGGMGWLQLMEQQASFRQLLFLPVLHLLSEVVENFSIVAIILTYPEQHLWIATVTSVATGVKWILSMLVISWVVAGLVFRGYKLIK